MKYMTKTLAFALFLIVMFSVVLLGTGYALAASPTKESEHLRGDFVDVGLLIKENAPIPQEELKEKFEGYNSVAYQEKSVPGEAEENDLQSGELPSDIKDGPSQVILTIFSEEGVEARLAAKKENAGGQPLSYEEILFIINDSVQSYYKYDRIVLSCAEKENLLYFEEESTCETDYVIRCCHKDFSVSGHELSYKSAMAQYNEVKKDILNVILYRIFLLDPTMKVMPKSGDILSSSDQGAFFNYILPGGFVLMFDATIVYRSTVVFPTEMLLSRKPSESDYTEKTEDHGAVFSLAVAKDIITMEDTFEEILKRFTEIKAPDFERKSEEGTVLEFWLDESGNTQLILNIEGKTIYYSKTDNEGKRIFYEGLFG